MPDETKLLCSACFNPLSMTTYKEGVYINPCTCTDKELYDRGKEEGHQEGYDDGRDMGRDEGYYEGFEAAEREAKEEIQELEEKLEKYSGLAEDDEYLERLGHEN